MNVSIDKSLCTGCGLCVDSCPEVFEMAGDTANPKKKNIDDSNEELVNQVKDAEGNCPVEAIKTS